MSKKCQKTQSKPQKHQNKFAYKVTFNDNYEKLVENVPLDHLCLRCYQQIEWKIQYGKYKKITDLSRCQKCQQKNVNKSYRSICDLCSQKEMICSKCGNPVTEFCKQPKAEKKGVEKELLQTMEEYLKTLKESSRRKILRLVEKGTISWDREKGGFYDKESGKKLIGLKFKNGDINGMGDEQDDDDDDDDDDMFGDDLSDGNNEKTEQKEKKTKKPQNKEEEQKQDTNNTNKYQKKKKVNQQKVEDDEFFQKDDFIDDSDDMDDLEGLDDNNSDLDDKNNQNTDKI